MRLKILVVRDRAADCFGTPIFVTSIGGGIRSFSDAVNGKDETMQKHCDDFDLYELGEYDDEHADFTLLGKPRQIAIGKDLKRSKDNDE